MFSNGSFSELTFSGNRSSIRLFNGKNINIPFSIKTTPTVLFKIIEIEPSILDGIILSIQKEISVMLNLIREEQTNSVVQIVLNLQKSSGATL